MRVAARAEGRGSIAEGKFRGSVVEATFSYIYIYVYIYIYIYTQKHTDIIHTNKIDIDIDIDVDIDIVVQRFLPHAPNQKC